MSIRTLRIPLAFVLVLAATVCLKAATVTWFGPQNITGDTDVKTDGTLFQAANFGTAAATTVNGVTFSGFTATSGVTSGTSGNLSLSASGTSGIRSTTSTTISAAPYSTLSSSYQALLNQTMFSFSGSSGVPAPNMSVTVNNLSIGQQYDVQFWVNDSRSGVTNIATRQTQVGSTLLSVNTTGTTGGLGQWVLGTFVADSTSQSFDLVGVNSGTVGPVTYATAMQVRAVPEPSSLAMLAGGAFTLLVFIHLRSRNPSRLVRGESASL
jgi:hypothetical protein